MSDNDIKKDLSWPATLPSGVKVLTDLDISFVSVCPQGANAGAKILLKKECVMSEEKKDVAQVNVNFDVDSLSKSLSETLKSTLAELSEKKVDKEAQSDAICSVVISEMSKAVQDVRAQLNVAIEQLQKDLAEIEKQDVAKVDEELTVNGSVFKKSQIGESVFAALKAAQDDQESLRKEIEMQKMQSRAEKEYPNVPGTASEKGEFLSVIEKSGDVVKNMGLALLKSANEKGEEFSKEIGSSTNGADGVTADVEKMQTDTDASVRLNALAKELSVKENIGFREAYMRILESDEGARLYDEHRGV